MYYDVRTLGRIFTITIAFVMSSAFAVTTPVRGTRKVGYALIVGLVLFAGVVLRSVYGSRATSNQPLRTAMIIYYAGPLGYFDALTVGGEPSGYEYGRMFCGALEAVFLRPFAWVPVIREVIPPEAAPLRERQSVRTIGRGVNYNAFGTILLDGWYDGGSLGILWMGLSLGLTSGWFWCRARASSSPLVVEFATLSSVWVLWSPLSWAGGFSHTGPVAIWLLLAAVAVKGMKRARASRLRQNIHGV